MTILNDKKILDLKKIANKVRRTILESLMEAGSGHPAGSLGMTDVFVAFYFHILRHNPKNPAWENRDRVILSNGHICPVLYAVMAQSGYFSPEEMKTLRRLGSRLQGHPHRKYLPGLETSSGPLGCGLSQAVGMTIADRIDNDPSEKFFYVFLSDGEMDSGNTWEGGMLASKEKLGNLIAVMDRNNIQIDGFTQDVMPLEPLKDKWSAWGWHTLEIDGHDFSQIVNAVEEGRKVSDKPTMIIAKTTPGRGVEEFEGKYEWHGKVPSFEEGRKAVLRLEEEFEELEKIS